MREKERIERIWQLLQTYWEEHQDLRFGQMLINLGICEDSPTLWDYDDESLEKHFEKLNSEDKDENTN